MASRNAAVTAPVASAGRPTMPTTWTDSEDCSSFTSTENLTADVDALRLQLLEEGGDTEDGNSMFGGRSDDDEDGAEFVEDLDRPLPDHACSYCTFHSDEKAALKCNICKKWFCNGKGNLNASHIIMHLLCAKHKEIAPHVENPLGDDVMECYMCGSKNIFLLGFVPSKEDHVAVLVCREPCLHSNTLKDMEWDPSAWLPLVEGRQLLSWVAEAPKRKDMKNCRQITFKQVTQLEEMWRDNPSATFDDLAKHVMLGQDGPLLPPIPQRFRDGLHYRDIFGPLISTEMSASRERDESFALTDVSISWKMNINKLYEGSFTATLDESQLTVGSLILFVHDAQKFESEAVVLRVEPNTSSGNLFHCELRQSSKTPPSSAIVAGYTVRLVFNSVPYHRMTAALTSFAEDETALSAHLYHSLLGQMTNPVLLTAEMPSVLSAPNLASLNASQERAVSAVLQRPLSLIQGPPGTGKTTTTATICYHLSRMFDAQILVCASSNVAIDELADRISKTGLSVVRILARSREDVPTTVEHLCLHRQVEQLARKSPQHSLLYKLSLLKQEIGMLKDDDFRKYRSLLEAAEYEILSNADVICCTCSAAADKRLAPFRLQHVVIDESTQAHEPETLIPIVLGAKQVVLVGDHCQLGPVVMSREAAAAGMSRSLFERLVSIGHKPHRLEIQYRMHPYLSQFSSNCFYEGTLQNGVTAEDRESGTIFPWPNPRKPLFFYNSIAAEEMGSSGTSVLNRNEAALAEKMLTTLIKNGANPDECGVITPYEAQRVFLINYLARHGPLGAAVYRRVEVASVDSFQGREKDFIIYSCVRSNNSHAIGFLKDWRRLNVALTRARKGVMVIGNAKVLAHHTLWHNFLQHCIASSLVVDGPVADLRPITITLPKPRLTLNAVNMTNLNGPSNHQQAMMMGMGNGGGHSNRGGGNGGGGFGFIGGGFNNNNNSMMNGGGGFNGGGMGMAPMYAISAATEDSMSMTADEEPYFEDGYVPGNMGSVNNQYATRGEGAFGAFNHNAMMRGGGYAASSSQGSVFYD